MSSNSVVIKIAQPYAVALLELAKTKKVTEKVSQDIQSIQSILLQSDKLKNFLANPLKTTEAKKEVIIATFGDQISENTLSFLMILVDRKRIAMLDSISSKYLELAYQMESLTIANISTSIALNSNQENLLTEKIKVMTDSKEVKLIVSVDPELIGGFTIQIGSKVIDTSIRGQLRQMASHLDVLVT
uniref:ATP synthase CF1 delta subunit n=1 Tax=Pyropia perforata TaxID=182771 RepID=A0A023I866_PYRPE|nr:ATP synthase CF1 delta subunit [Neoporphyra perforata]AGV01093.1 ATP synthase CF1 delta subunit [Neoporphyra perforata]AHB35230.1 ATP synthase CF1 delta subunit [Neoporphyra perforata]AIA19392.1 ATP synthase CF1 delta subunit [Neoporphyra perforata]AIA19810.1 ATP synthase CF1 delta subunit [Neoporphyra perforata]AIA20228.1 ATP synthase CF1 delta subunit [Neoporphyra perforata]